MRALGLLMVLMAADVEAAEPQLIAYPDVALPQPVRGDASGRAAWDALAALYERGVEPALVAMDVDLLAALVTQAIADDTNGRTPWQASPFWGDPGTSTSRQLRARIAARVEAMKASGDAALPLAQALLDDGLEVSRRAGLAILQRTRTPAARAMEATRAARQQDFGPLLDRAIARVHPVIDPKTARWVQVVVEGRTLHGWLLAEGPDLRVLTWHAIEEVVPAAKAKIVNESLRDAAALLLKVRALESDAQAKVLSREGMLTGQFESGLVSVPEILVAGWLRRAGDERAAATSIAPRVAQLPDIRMLDTIAREGVAAALHERMLIAWTHRRDDAEALAIATALSGPLFDGYSYQARTRELAAQLTQRKTEDPLPTPAQWTALEAKLSRPEQVLYLVRRLRAINAIQWGQPGGVSYEEPQTAEPYASAASPKTALVNPLVELLAMKLTARDLEPIVPWLGDAAYMRMYSYWRDFHPARELHRAGAALAWIVNDAMQMELVDVRTFGRLTTQQREAELTRIAEVIAARRDLSPRDLLRARIRAAKSIAELGEAITRAGQDGDPQALALLLERERDFEDQHYQLARLAFLTGDAAALVAADRWLADPRLHVLSRVWAALIVLSHRGPQTAPALVVQLARDLGKPTVAGQLRALAIDRLGRAKLDATPAGRALVCGLIDSTNGGDDHDGKQPAFAVLHRVVLARCPGAAERAAAAIDATEVYGYTSGELDGQRVAITQTWGDQAAAVINDWRQPAPEWQVLLPDAQRAKARVEIKAWLLGGAPGIRAPGPAMPPPWPEVTRP